MIVNNYFYEYILLVIHTCLVFPHNDFIFCIFRHERKMFEKYQKTIRSIPDKKDREEIDMLKNQINELQEEMKRKETRWTSSQTRLKDKLELVELENKELKDEIKLLEKKRIEWMQKEAATTSSIHLQRKQKIISLMSIPITVSNFTDHTLLTSYKYLTRSSENNSTSLSTSTSALSSSTATTSSVPRKLASRLLLDNPTIDKGNKQYEESQHSDGKIERIYKNGAREILFANGTRKEISSDGQSIVVSFFNGDIKQIYPDKRVVYYYADAQTSHTTYPDSLEVLQFQNGQIEKHYPDGTKEITFPDQTVKYLFPNGSEESIFPDGTVIRVDVSGDKTMEFPNGQREIHNSQFKRREYPDGTVKTVYPDGRQETRYSTGRVRLKDKDGNVIMDRIC
ncbi:hypothetical protein LOTGIDRAFT_103874 [Lottia gigantea]|uniref:Centrosomal P4.1-associated protein n=1 Tax=Lottia gigantea TaxID=225164 RepID=V4ASX8_LOTGI|nr:hypothetical protein LOTGIDRAFT_103874 [Lottia gigantea]ESO97980.1 hypothetical protein LOTGIDRAFT_103874 [Lottia gigantea]